MRIVFSEDKVTLGDLMQMETGRTMTQTAQFLCKFVVDDSGAPVTEKAAWEYIRGLSMPAGKAAMVEFWRFMGGIKADAVNPPNETPS